MARKHDNPQPNLPEPEPAAELVEKAEPGMEMQPIDSIARRLVDTMRGQECHTMRPRQGTPLMSCPTNLDLGTLEGRGMLFAAGCPGDLVIPPNGTLKIRARYFVVMPDTSINEEDGEVSEFSRTVFFDMNGGIFRTTANHAPTSVGRLLAIFTQEEWAKGIPLVLSERKSKRGTTYHDIRVDITAMK